MIDPMDRYRQSAKGGSDQFSAGGDGGILYAAYSSNLDRTQMIHRCPTARVLCKAVLPNHQLLFRGVDGMAVAMVERKEGMRVPVLIWSLFPDDLEALDRYEMCPRLYRRETMRFRLKGGGDIKALIYLMNPGRGLGRPGFEYFCIMCNGYEQAGFRIDEFQAAMLRSAPVSTGAGTYHDRSFAEIHRTES